MPFCPDCGTQTSEDMRFCPECGHQVVLRKNGRGVTKRRVAGITVGSVLGIILIAVLAAQSSSPDMAPLPPTEPGWVRLQIQDVGSIDYPSDFLELQSGDYREFVDEFQTVYELPSSDFTLQQVGLNELRPTAFQQYRRVMFHTSYLSRGEEVWRAKQKYTMTQQELSESHIELVNDRSQQYAAMKSSGLGDMRIIDSGSLRVLEVNGMFSLVWTYTRQLNDNPVVSVKEYVFPNYNRVHRLTFEYRVEDTEECGDVYARILASFRLQ